jgi:trigger factor
VSDRGLKLATEPKVTLADQESAVDKLMGGQSDLDYTLALELLPQIQLADFKGMKVERMVADVTDAEVDEAVGKIAEQNRPFSAKAAGAKAERGDRLVIDFNGRVDGKWFEGGTGTDVVVNLGAGSFLPGFEDQLTGAAAGEQKQIKVTFPSEYANTELAGKEAEFDVTVKAVETPGAVSMDDAFAKTMGLESLDRLKQAVRERLQRDLTAASRQRLKRQLLDQLDESHKFALPPTLAEQEFNNVWNAVEGDLKAQNRTFADEGTTEEKAREEYRAIADRRVRLGLVLAEIGEKNGIHVSEQELSRAVVARAQQVPGHEQQIWDYYRKHPEALASLRAPIFEDKVIDFLIELADVTEKHVSREELERDEEEEKPGAE